MTERHMPRYPVYLPSKGRVNHCPTVRFLLEANVPFHLVVESPEADAYIARFGAEHVLVLPFHDLGLGSIPARNWIWEHAKIAGAERHWVIDDNITGFFRRYRGKRMYVDAGIALRVCEDLTDRYENIAVSGLNYYMFVPDDVKRAPLQVNCHVYSCMLINTDLSYRWRGRYNEDTDLCLQVLSSGYWCTVLLNTFLADKENTMVAKGGNTDALYQGDGRLKMARSLERMWPGVVETKRRFHRPQHVVNWKKFDTPLRLKPGIDLSQLTTNEYGMELVQVAETVKSQRMRGILDDWQQTHGTTDDQSQAGQPNA